MGQTKHTFRVETRQILRLNYLLHLPETDEDEPGGKWPLILFLHGKEERGDDIEQVKTHGIPKMVEFQPAFPFIVLSPQCPLDTWWSNHLEALSSLLDSIVKTHAVDKHRVYLTGLSPNFAFRLVTV